PQLKFSILFSRCMSKRWRLLGIIMIFLIRFGLFVNPLKNLERLVFIILTKKYWIFLSKLGSCLRQNNMIVNVKTLSRGEVGDVVFIRSSLVDFYNAGS